MSTKKTPKTPAEVLNSLQLSGQEDLDKQIKNWVLWDRNEATLDQVIEAVHDQDWHALRVRLCNRIPFGTAGMRGGMRAGFDSINDLVIIQTAQGLAAYLTDCYPSIQKRETQGVVIGYDGRYNSKRFAQLTSAVFLNSGYKVYLFNRMTPTPFIPFTVSALKCLAGVVVTASHNPKEDNGFKVYAANGAQILPPHDKKIYDDIMANLEPTPSSWDLCILTASPLVEDPYRQIYPMYYEMLKKLLPPVHLETNECSQLRFIYTPMHGVGYSFMREAFYQARLKPLIPVPEQKDPDPEFHTLVYPNPEEGREALLMAIKNDPDADRLAAAELDPKGRWKIFTGNELGALLAWWALESYRARTSKPDVSNCIMLSSMVSSRIAGAIARAEGFTHVETLTGLKWMGNKALELQAAGRTVLFAFEEPLGFMFGMNVADKDGITAATHLATMACHLRTSRSLTLIEKLREIYDMYGYHATLSSYYTCEDPELIEQIFERLRNFEEDLPGTYPKCIFDGAFEVVHVRDLTKGLDTAYADRKARLPMVPSEQMIRFTFTNGFVVSLRSTSRDHKLRYYTEICALPEEKEWLELDDRLHQMTDAVVEEFSQPYVHGLIRASQFDMQ
ncbi:glucose 1,6-bisphosphate synthase-like [Drosophila miranda]|uniref:glucose 1,6-bisphosphate synthase-like n=1 Tax=Drosophila miranda TaxID=7229 RepID=UPI00143F6CC6|nr:glucose 1,6-bisphosphate synthase-like [Drosophila miranda]